jgi:hypothetical protein
MPLPLWVMSAVSGLIADTEGAVTMAEGVVSNVQGSFHILQGALLESQYLMQVAFWAPIIAIEFKGLLNIITGAWEVFINTLRFLPEFGLSFADGVFALFTFSMSWMMCLFKNIANMQTCIFYYLLEAIGQILYLPVRICLWMAYQLKIDFYPYETKFWDFIEYIDKIVLKFAGFHISHYPKNIRNQCYNCKRLKISSLVEHSMPLVHDVTDVLPPALGPGVMKMITGGTQLMNPFG